MSAAERRFVEGVHQSTTDVGRFRTDSQLVKLGHATCDDLRAHAGLQQIADILEATGSPSLPPGEVGAIMSAAEDDLCPAYAGRLNPVPTGG
jgi:hypothetical protein